MFRSQPSPQHDDDDPRICYCMKVHRKTLIDAIAAGAHDLRMLQERTRAGTGCGTCRIDLLALLAQHAREHSQP